MKTKNSKARIADIFAKAVCIGIVSIIIAILGTGIFTSVCYLTYNFSIISIIGTVASVAALMILIVHIIEHLIYTIKDWNK